MTFTCRSLETFPSIGSWSGLSLLNMNGIDFTVTFVLYATTNFACHELSLDTNQRKVMRLFGTQTTGNPLTDNSETP